MVIGGGPASPAKTTPLTDLPEILRISERQICKEGIFALVDRLPGAKMPPFPPYMPRRQSFGLPVCLEGKLFLTNRWFGKNTARERLKIRGALPLRYLPTS
jgi:hypothetical protein